MGIRRTSNEPVKTTLKLFAILRVLFGIIYPVTIRTGAVILPKRSRGKSSISFRQQPHRFSPDKSALFRRLQVKYGG